MKYLLAVLTHGDHGDWLRGALASFEQRAQASGPPSEVVVFDDGSMPSLTNVWTLSLAEGNAAGLPAGTKLMGGPPVGFCTATRHLWQAAAASDADYVFWLEHDFVFTRDVDLRELAQVLDDHQRLAQMALMRDAVNAQEKAAGGLYESRPGQYALRIQDWIEPMSEPPCEPTSRRNARPWLEHTAYFTTNPSLMRRDFMAEHPWPGYGDQCEGRFGIDLVQAGYSFGVWGAGEPWVTHVGTRDGFGY